MRNGSEAQGSLIVFLRGFRYTANGGAGIQDQIFPLSSCVLVQPLMLY